MPPEGYYDLDGDLGGDAEHDRVDEGFIRANVHQQFQVIPAHVLDDSRRAALAEIDNQVVSWFLVRVGLVASVGFFTDAYDIFAITIAMTMLNYVYGHNEELSPKQRLGITVATPIGNLVGMAVFGYLADRWGRKRMYGVEMSIMILAAFGQAISGQGPAVGIVSALVCWRLLLGIAVGGDYPLSAVIASEFSASRFRGRFMTLVFSAQGWGQLVAALVGIIVTSAYKSAIEKQPVNPGSYPSLPEVDYLWRLIIGLGCVPGAIALYYRLTIPETPRFRMDVERNVMAAIKDIEHMVREGAYVPGTDSIVQLVDVPKASWADLMAYFSVRENQRMLFATAWSWFAQDMAFYGMSLNSSFFIQAIGLSVSSGQDTQNIPQIQKDYYSMLHDCIGSLILSVAGLIPGFYVCYLFIDKWGRKPIQLMGFIVLAVLFIIMGFGYDKLTASTSAKGAFVFLYCLTNFFQNFGPNTTTFIVPGEAFPTRYRATAHGFCAACGRLGAVIAQIIFYFKISGPCDQRLETGENCPWMGHLFEIFALFMITGIFSTLLLTETKERTLEDISNETQVGFISGVVVPAEMQMRPLTPGSQ